LQNLRKYGKPPYSVVLVHGGPGAPGSLRTVAEEISADRGVIEALQTGYSIDSLLVELQVTVTLHGIPPLTLVGHSWGAWLSLLFASRYPDLVRKLILVAAGPFEDKYAAGIMEIRMERLGHQDAANLTRLMHQFSVSSRQKKDAIFHQIAKIIRKADTFEPDGLSYSNPAVEYKMYESIWREAEEMRSSGELLQHAGRISCLVLALHGDYDPHPYLGVKLPLEQTCKNFRFKLLDNCGHEPWSERFAKDSFYTILKAEL
jgi:pimeloyl-ACP methyl ester carboxylesterase